MQHLNEHLVPFDLDLDCSQEKKTVCANESGVHIHQPFSKMFFVFFSKTCEFECNTSSDWLNRYIHMLLTKEKSGEQD